jgi:hypothetical protein
MRWAGHVARVGDRRDAYIVWWGNLRKREYLEEVSVERKIILKWIFKNGQDWSGSVLGEMVGCCDAGNEPSGSIRCGEFLDQLRNC